MTRPVHQFLSSLDSIRMQGSSDVTELVEICIRCLILNLPSAENVDVRRCRIRIRTSSQL